jgi:hypothetical protein
MELLGKKLKDFSEKKSKNQYYQFKKKLSLS